MPRAKRVGPPLTIADVLKRCDISPTGCWIPRKKPASNGYCYFWISGKHYLSHRRSYELARGMIPHGLVIDHLCRVPKCCNPDHLEPVTPRENSIRGDKAKLNENQVIEIRRLAVEERIGSYEISKMFGISVGYVPNIVVGERWELTANKQEKTPTRYRRAKSLTRNDVYEIRNLRKSGMLLKDIAKMFNKKVPYISQICSGALDERYGP